MPHAAMPLQTFPSVRIASRSGGLCMALIERTHRHYVAPTMLRMAVLHARVGAAVVAPVSSTAMRA
jgi:hypothetical protein